MKRILITLFVFSLIIPFTNLKAQSIEKKNKVSVEERNQFSLMKLPYSLDALEPHISKTTLEYHYGKHHKAYVDNLNRLKKGTEFENATLEEIVLNSKGSIFNNAAQIWNHNLYWNGFTPKSSLKPIGSLKEAIEKEYKTFENFKEKFNSVSMSLFGSGWAWLVKNQEGKLEIVQTSNADNPLRQGLTPIIGCDLWEHSYYIDQKNNRAAYLDAFWKVINWEIAEKNYKK
jgi:Fe-Mn family superoxide dismutase